MEFIKKVNEQTYEPYEPDTYDIVTKEDIQNAANEKLYKIEEAEKEMEIPFLVLYNALKNGIYYRDLNFDGTYDEEIYFEEPEHLSIGLNGLVCAYTDYYEDDLRYEYNYKDYRKTWALRREELELPF